MYVADVTCVRLQESDEFRLRQSALAKQQRHEAQLARRRIEEEKQRLKQRQKEAVINYVSQVRRRTLHNVFIMFFFFF